MNSSLFYVKTPAAIVTDLGTEFGVAVSENGDTTSHVFQGVVKMKALGGTGSAGGNSIELNAGESARITKDEDTGSFELERIDLNETPIAFVRQLAFRSYTSPEEAYIRAVQADKPLAYWPLNEPAYTKKFLDLSGNGFHGLAVDNVRAGQSGPLPGQSRAAAFQGDGYIQVGCEDRFATPDGFTFEAWMLPEKDIERAQIISVHIVTTTSTKRFDWIMSCSVKPFGNNGPGIAHELPGTNADSIDVPPPEWMHVAMVRDRDNVVRFYQDGWQIGSRVTDAPVIAGQIWLSIGSMCSGDKHWRGRLAHVAVYPRPLSAECIRAHFQRGNSQKELIDTDTDEQPHKENPQENML